MSAYLDGVRYVSPSDNSNPRLSLSYKRYKSGVFIRRLAFYDDTTQVTSAVVGISRDGYDYPIYRVTSPTAGVTQNIPVNMILTPLDTLYLDIAGDSAGDTIYFVAWGDLLEE